MDPRDQEPPTPSPPKPAALQAPDVIGTASELLNRKKVLQDLKTRLQEKHSGADSSEQSSPQRPPEMPEPPGAETYYDTDSDLDMEQRLTLVETSNDYNQRKIYEMQYQLDIVGNNVALLSGNHAIPHQNALR